MERHESQNERRDHGYEKRIDPPREPQRRAQTQVGKEGGRAQEIEKGARQRLAQIAVELESDSIQPRTVIRVGAPFQVIVETAKKQNPLLLAAEELRKVMVRSWGALRRRVA